MGSLVFDIAFSIATPSYFTRDFADSSTFVTDNKFCVFSIFEKNFIIRNNYVTTPGAQ